MKIYLDLLPKERKDELKRGKFFREILREEFLFFLPIVVFVIILLNIYYLLSIQHNASVAAKSQTESQDKYQEINSYEEKFKNVNENAAKLIKIQQGHLYWAGVFNKFGEAMPDGISISDFSTKNYDIFLVGKAKNRDTLLNFKNRLEADKCFININVPLSNLVVRNDVDFQIDLKVSEDCLKMKN